MKKHSELDSKYWHNYCSLIDPEIIEDVIQEEFIDYNGLNIHLDILDTENDIESKNNIIFLHATSVYSRFYMDICYLLSKKGFRVFLPDMIGHGLSEGIPGHFSMKELTDIVSLLVVHIQQNYGGKIYVMGSSLGGITTLYSMAADTRIDAAICHNAAIFNEKAYKEIIKVKGILRILQPLVPYIAKIIPMVRLSVFRYLQKESLVNSPKGFRIYDLLLKDPLLQEKYTFKSLRTQMRDKMDKPIEEITKPIMFITGENEELFPLDYVKRVYNRLSNQNNEFAIIKNAAHLIFQENTQETLEIISNFLKKQIK